MDLKILVVLGLICWWAVIPALIVGLRLRHARHAERVAGPAPLRLACEGRRRPSQPRVRNPVDI
jgi:hypothetical protein